MRLSSAFGRGCYPRESGVAAGGLLREKRTHTDGENTCGGKIRAAGGAEKSSRRNMHRTGRFGRNINRKRRRWNVRREDRQDVRKIQAESVRLIFTGKFGGKFTRRVRMSFGRNGRIKALRAAGAKRQEGSAPYRQKRSREK